MTRMLLVFLVYATCVLLAIVAFYTWTNRIVKKSAREQQNLDDLNDFVHVLAMEALEEVARQQNRTATYIYATFMATVVDQAINEIALREHPNLRWTPGPLYTEPAKPKQRQRKKMDWNKVGF